MKNLPLVFAAIWSLSAIADPAAEPAQSSSHDLSGTWVLQVQDLQHKLVATLSIQFSGEPASSCIGGTWKRLRIQSHASSDENFFPATDPLSYSLMGENLTIGRNEVCDAYLHLNGKFDHDTVRGEYVGFGLGGGKQRGFFVLVKGHLVNGT